MDNRGVSYQRKIILPIIAFVLLGALLILLDGQEIWRVLSQADWRILPPALLFTAVSYLCVSYTYTLVSHMMAIPIRSGALTTIGFVTTAMNHVVRSGGVVAYTVRYLLMKPYGVEFNEVLSSSLIHYYLTSLDMIVMLPAGIAYLMINAPVSDAMRVMLGVLLSVILFIAVGATLLLFIDPLRLWLTNIIVRLGKTILRRDLSIPLNDFNQHMSLGSAMLRKHPDRSVTVLLLTFVDWISNVLVLWLCFDAFGEPLSLGAVVATFVVGVMAGAVLVIPGGIGVQEASITALAVLLGASFEQAVLAALLYRVIYYFIPYTITPWFYWRLMRTAKADFGD